MHTPETSGEVYSSVSGVYEDRNRFKIRNDTTTPHTTAMAKLGAKCQDV